MRKSLLLLFATFLIGVAGAALAVSLARPEAVSGSRSESAIAIKPGEVVYWAGSLPHRRLEVTRTNAGTFVRYLPRSVVSGAGSLHLTIATYRMTDAYSIAARAARSPDAVTRRGPGGGLVVWRTERPTSVYMAYRGSDRLVEVFDPQPRRAQTIALSGRIRAVLEG